MDETAAGEIGDTRAIFVGRLIPVKRLERFFLALIMARRQHSALKGIIAGDGMARPRLEKMATNMCLSPESLTFLGQRNDVPALLRSAHMLVLCSDEEGFPNVLLEAMAARLPVITTPAGDASIVVENGVTGYVVPFNDVEAMARRMVQLARSPELCRQLGEAGRKRVEQHYSCEGLGDRLLAIYNDVAKQSRHPELLRMVRRSAFGGRGFVHETIASEGTTTQIRAEL
jgi:glycosyltransferase involved in cell wall biosynthesis